MRKLRLSSKSPVFAKPAQPERYDVATKRIILEIAGDDTTDPSTLGESLKLRDNLQYGDNEYVLLQIRLDEYVKSCNKDASVTPAEVNACTTVGSCVDLVKKHLS